MLQPHVYATQQRVEYAARMLGAEHGPRNTRAFARAAAAPYYSRPFVTKVNDTIPHRYVLASVPNDPTAPAPGLIQMADLLFAYNPDQAPEDTEDIPGVLKLGTQVQRSDPNTVHAVSWQLLDEWLGKHPDRYKDAHQLVYEWQLLGVAHNDVLPGGFTHAVPINAPTRALNVVVGGRVGTFNVWGAEVRAGMRLYFKVERREAGERGWRLTPVASYLRPECAVDECVVLVGAVIESASTDPFFVQLQPRKRAGFMRDYPITNKVVVYLGI